MSLIQLPPSTARLLTSSQVITSVSSVVKELVENSLDAGAASVEVKLVNYGLDRIEVQDDGRGIAKPDVGLAFQPHTTSKIVDFSDLGKLLTYGFRGEALAALCNVADINITTRTAEDEYASAFTIDKRGMVSDVKPSHFGKGTTIIVSNLFHNLPVRKQFMKSSNNLKNELKKTEAIVKNLALINTKVRFAFCHNKCLVWQKAPAQNLKESTASVLGYCVSCKLEEISSNIQQNEITLLLPQKYCKDLAPLCSSTIDALRVFINCRPVQYKKLEKMVVQLISQHFAGIYPRGKYPTCIISIEVPPSDLDVNLEPNKTRVFFQNEDQLFSSVERLIDSYYQTMENPKRPRLEIEESSEEQQAVEKDAHLPAPLNHAETPEKSICAPEDTSTTVSKTNRLLGSPESEKKDNNEDKIEIESLWQAADKALGFWSCGRMKSANGDVIEGTSTLLLPSKYPVAEKSLNDQTESNNLHKEPKKQLNGNTHTKEKTISTGKKSKFLNNSYHSVNSQMGCKNLENFTNFSRSFRSKILAENPGIPFTDVANLLAQKWKELSPEERRAYEGREEKKTSPLSEKGQRSSILATSRTVPKIKSTFASRKASSSTTLEISMEEICSKGTPKINSELPTLAVELIGQLKPEGLWVYKRVNEIGIIRHWGLQEKIILKQLVKEHSVPVVPLEVPVLVSEFNFNPKLWQCLLNLDTEKTSNGITCITAPVIVKNGFRIEKHDDEFYLTEAASTIRFYGLPDLQEVLSLLLHSTVLEHCRPKKVLAYFESEAVRMARQAPAIIGKEKLAKLLMSYNIQDNLCLHRKPIFETVHILAQCS